MREPANIDAITDFTHAVDKIVLDDDIFTQVGAVATIVVSVPPVTESVDGEPVEAMTFRIECMPKRLRMHLPADCPLRTDAATVRP